MKHITRVFIVGFFILLSADLLHADISHTKWAEGNSSLDFLDDASAKLEKSIQSAKSPFAKKLYGAMFYTPLWVDEKGLTSFGDQLIDTISRDKTLDDAMPTLKQYRELVAKVATIKESGGGTLTDKLALELEFTALYKTYAEYILYGGINWSSFKAKLKRLAKMRKTDAGWVVYNPKNSAVSILNSAIEGGHLKEALLEAEPNRFKYKQLKKYLVKYVKIDDDKSWHKFPKYRGKLKKGMKSKLVPILRHNLMLEGDAKGCSADANSTNLYNECLVKAVKKFQLRHGIKGDGVVGKGTYKALSMTPVRKIKLIRLNLDKIKRLRRDEARVRIELNIPSFRLQFYDDQKLVSTMRVVVGKVTHPTPSFGDVVQYIVVNPWWKIPESIVKKEMLRHLVEDPYYYERKGKVLHATWSEDSERIDPGSVDWASYVGARHIPYRFMQVPSRHNALGKIKFIFPNQFSVYIHDTPSKNLFFRSKRAFSHGCMRIQKPREMLENFARFNDNIDVDAVMKRLEGTQKLTIGLKTRVPIDITYLTAFVDDYGNINFRGDIYGYDKYMLKNYKYIVDKYKMPTPKKAKKSKSKAKKAKKVIKVKKPKANKDDGYTISEEYPE